MAAAVFIAWRFVAARGGDEPLLRRIVHASRPLIDPRSPRHVAGLSLRLLMLTVGGLVLVLLALLLEWLAQGRV